MTNRSETKASIGKREKKEIIHTYIRYIHTYIQTQTEKNI